MRSTRWTVWHVVLTGGLLVFLLQAAPAAAQCPAAGATWDFGMSNQEAHGVAVSGNYAYVADDYGLTIYDISGLPAVIKKKGELLLDEPAKAVAVAGDYAYVADGFSGLVVVDVSDVTAPFVTDTWDSPGSGEDVAVSSSLAVLADGSSGLAILELQAGGHVSYKNTWSVAGASAQGVTLVGNLAYLANGWDGLRILDLTDPNNPVEEPGINPPDWNEWAMDVVVSGDYAYVADRFDGLVVVDLNPPGSLTPEIAGTADTNGSAVAVALTGQYALVADSWSGMAVVDVKTPSSPAVVTYYDTPGSSSDLVVAGTLAYIADTQGGLQVADVADPTDPSDAGGLVTAGTVRDMTVAGSVGYVADGYGGLQLLDLTNPSAPGLFGGCGVDGLATGVVDGDEYAYLTVLGDGLAVVDVATDINNPALETTLPLSGVMYGLSGWGSTLYVAAGPAGLHVVDVSTPTSPLLQSTVSTSADAVAVATDGTYAYVAMGLGGLAVVDPTTASVTGTLDGLGYVSAVAVVNGYVILGAGNVLSVVSVANPAHPNVVGTLADFGTIRDLAAPRSPAPPETAIVYVAAGTNGFLAVDVSDPAAPSVLASRVTVRPAGVVAVSAKSSTAWTGSKPLLEGIDIACPTCVGLDLTADDAEILTGGNTTTITATVRDLAGSLVAGASVTGTTTLGSLSAFSSVGSSGEYQATLTSGASSGTATISVTVDGVACPAETTVRIACAAGDPLPPSGVTATPAGSDSIDLDWLTMTGASGYRVYRGSYMVAELSGGGSSAYTDTGLSPGTEYCYTITSLDPCGGETDPSAEVCATTGGQRLTCLWPMATMPRPEETGAGYYTAAMLGDTLVLGDDRGFSLWDVSDPENPVFLSHWDGPDWPIDLETRSDGLIVATMQFEGLVLVDASDPEHPFLLGSHTGYWAYSAHAAFSGEYLYVTAGAQGFRVLDIHDPANPEVVFTSTQSTWGVAVLGTHLFLTDPDSHLLVYDISDPENPVQAGSADAPGDLNRLRVDEAGSGGGTVYLYASLWNSGTYSNTLAVFDITDPVAPTHAGTYTAPDRIFDFRKSGDLAYLACDDAGFRIVDLSDPSAPDEVGSLATAGKVHAVALSGTTVFAGDSQTIFDAIDASDPSDPSLLWSGDRDGELVDVAVSGSHAYVVLNPDGLVIASVDDPWDPVAQGSLTTPGEANAVAVSGRYAYLADGSGGLRVIDVFDPTAPHIAGSRATTDARGVAVAGTTVYVADGSAGLRVISVSNPGSPSIVGTADTPGYAYDVVVSGSYAYVADGDGGLQVIDISTPAAPTIVGSAATADTAMRLAVSGDRVYVAEGLTNLEIFDISDPTSPVWLSVWGDSTAAGVYDVHVEGTTAWVTGLGNIYVMDVSDPTDPEMTDFINLPSYRNWGLAISDDMAYVAGGWALDTVSLGCTAPLARFEVTDRGLMQDFTDTSFFAPTSWAWDFGDGGTSSDRNPTHTYAVAGDYTVSLTVTNDNGSNTTTRTISVGCDLDHDGAIGGPDVTDEVAEIYDSDGILASEAGGPEHLGSSQYDTNGDGVLNAADIAWIIRRAP